MVIETKCFFEKPILIFIFLFFSEIATVCEKDDALKDYYAKKNTALKNADGYVNV